ncbi:hypothetical protein PFISCL1PPCAC_19812, partial [Pristionchus fissidentatus]
AHTFVYLACASDTDSRTMTHLYSTAHTDRVHTFTVEAEETRSTVDRGTSWIGDTVSLTTQLHRRTITYWGKISHLTYSLPTFHSRSTIYMTYTQHSCYLYTISIPAQLSIGAPHSHTTVHFAMPIKTFSLPTTRCHNCMCAVHPEENVPVTFERFNRVTHTTSTCASFSTDNIRAETGGLKLHERSVAPIVLAKMMERAFSLTHYCRTFFLRLNGRNK